MADKKVKVEVDIETNAEGSIAQLKELKKQLRETAAGSAEFKKLANEIDDLEDKLKGAKQGAADWIDSLESAGGPLGAVGAGLNKAKVAFSSFNTALKASVIGLVVAAIGGLVAAFSKSEEATKKLQPLLIGLEKILGGILRAVQPLFDAFLGLATKALPYVTQAVGVVYSGITALLQSIGSLGSALVKVFKGDFKGAWEDAKASVTSFDDNFKAAKDRFNAGTKEMTATEKEELEKQNKAREEAAKKRKEADDKETERLKKLAEERKKNLEDAGKAETDAYKETLSDRDREIYDAGLVLNERLAAVDKAGTGDRALLQEAYRIKLKEINDKYDKEEKDKADKDREEKIKAADEWAKYQLDQFNKLKDLQLQTAENTFKTNQIIAQSWVDLGQNIAGIFGSLINVFEEGSGAAKAFGIAQVAINAAASIGQILTNSKAAGFEYTKTINSGNAIILAAIPKLINPITAPLGAAEIAAAKTSIAGAVAGKAALKASTTLQIGAVAATSAAQIAAILSAKKSSASASGGGAETGGGGAAVPAFAGVPSLQAPQLQVGGGQSPTAAIGETISAAQRPIRAYVVSGDVSSQQALDRRTSRAATFAGG